MAHAKQLILSSGELFAKIFSQGLLSKSPSYASSETCNHETLQVVKELYGQYSPEWWARGHSPRGIGSDIFRLQIQADTIENESLLGRAKSL